MQRVAVVGGGIVGASAAFHLAMAGADVTLIENETPGRATSAGAGIIAPGTSLRSLPPFFELAQPAVAYYPQLVDQLTERGFADTGYEVCGKLIVADTDEKAAAAPRNRALFEERRAAGMPNIGAIEEVTPEQARELLPILGDVLSAMYVPEAARVDGAKMRDALTAAARSLGAKVLTSEARLMTNGRRVTAVAVGHDTIPVDAVVIATGAWTNRMLEPLGTSLPIDPQKGQILHIDMPGQDTTNWPILDWSGPQYQLCFGPHRVVCGATREFNSGYDLRVTADGVQELLNEQLRLCPGLAVGTIAEVRVGLRPYSGDAVPFIGPVPGWENAVVSSGHGPSGLQLGPYSGLLAADIAVGKQPAVDLTSFRLDRPLEYKEIP